MTRPFHLAAVITVVATGGAAQQDPVVPDHPPPASCNVCHPSATKGLRQSSHAFTLDREASCTTCHGEASPHAASALDSLAELTLPPPVAAESCHGCHQGLDLEPRLGAHSWSRRITISGMSESLPPPRPADTALGLEWSALVAAGIRFVDVGGSRDRYETDINLDPGFRLTELEIEGTGDGDRWADLVSLRAHNVADPLQRVEGRVEKHDLYSALGRFTKTDVVYRASGDYHRVDRDSQETRFDLSLDLTADIEVFGSFSRFARDGFWLTSRIGNRLTSPLASVPDVASPRRYDADLGEVGTSMTLLGVRTTLAVEYRDDSQQDRWTYDRTSPVNPAFPESEDFLSVSSLRGPGARWTLARDFEGMWFELDGRFLDLERETMGAGVARGFDFTDFITTTDSDSSGDARTWVLDANGSVDIGDHAALLLQARWLDHREQLDFAQTEVTFFPTLGTSTTVTTNRRQVTTRRAFDWSAELEVEPIEGLTISGGYLWSREELALPDLEAGDNDFLSGTIRDDGILAAAHWRPNEHWVLSADYRRSRQDGPELHELVERDARGIKTSIRYKTGGFWVETFFSDRQRENDVSPSRYRSASTGVTASVQRGDVLDLYASWVFSDIDSRTLTNFYFDPDPNPQPTVVGFDGTTHTVSAGLGLHPEERVTWRFDAAYTDTEGSFDIRLLDWRADLSVEVAPGGSAGVLFRQVDYEEAGGADDYDALITLVYWRQKLGRAN